MRTRLLAATLTAAAALTLTACSSGSSSTAAAPSTATAGASAPAATPAAGSTPGSAASGSATSDPAASDPAAPPATPKPSPPADAGLPAKPDTATVDKLVAALNAIDPDIVAGDPAKAADRARSQCQSIYQFPKDRAKLVDLTNQRFTSANHPSGFGADQAAKILDAVRANICP